MSYPVYRYIFEECLMNPGHRALCIVKLILCKLKINRKQGPVVLRLLIFFRFELLENKKDEYLDSSKSSFIKALQLYQPDQCDADERWLQHYILAKIAEKQQKEPSEYLDHYYMVTD